MSEAAVAGPIRATLIDIANCIGCRACQVACKQWNERDGEQTQLEPDMGFQNPAALSAKTYTLIAFHQMDNPAKPGGLDSAYVMQRCLHCLEPACVSACPTTALHRQSDGPVSYDVEKCIGCRYCVLACPWDVPTSAWDTLAPKISKCTHCADRADQPVPIAFNGKAVSNDAAFTATPASARIRRARADSQAEISDAGSADTLRSTSPRVRSALAVSPWRSRERAAASNASAWNSGCPLASATAASSPRRMAAAALSPRSSAAHAMRFSALRSRSEARWARSVDIASSAAAHATRSSPAA